MELKNRMTFEMLYKNRQNMKKVFFFRICGTGMGAGACLLREAGLQVEGADKAFYPPMSTYLESSKIPLYKLSEITPDFLRKFDLIVIGNVVPREGEFGGRFVEELGVPFASLPDVLSAFVLKDKNVVGVAGTHGKTTTTFLMLQLFEKLGKRPGHLIGGVLDDRPPSSLGKDDLFFIEADEYDSAYFQKVSKFRLYSLDHLILTSLEFDHGDIFENVEKIEEQFAQAIPEISSSFILNTDYPSCQKLYEKFRHHDPSKRWVRFGENSEVGPKDIEMGPHGSSFTLEFSGKAHRFSTNLIGRQNVLNLAVCLIFAKEQGFSIEKMQEAIKALKMVKRRQETRGKYKGAVIIDDFAHHPRAVILTIESIRLQYPGKRIVTIFEPNSWTSRSSIFQKEFAQSLGTSDALIVTVPQRESHIACAGKIDCHKLVEDVRSEFEIPAQVIQNLPELRDAIDQNSGPDSLILVLSNGTCLGLWESSFKDEIEKI